MTMRLMTRALELAERGWYVFPLRPFDKRPLPRFTRWEQQATTTMSQIERWWAEAPYNIGVATGPSDLLVVDCDVPKDNTTIHGIHRLAHLAQQASEALPRTFSVQTPSGGLHQYFSVGDASLGNTAGKLGGRIDTRGVGGYVVGPGSVRPDGYYAIIERRPVASLPTWLITALTPTKYPAGSSVQLTAEHANQYLQAIVREGARRVSEAAVGTRNSALNTAAFILGQLVSGGEINEQEAWTLLRGAAGRHVGTKSFTESEMLATIRSGLAAGAKHPRPLIDHHADTS